MVYFSFLLVPCLWVYHICKSVSTLRLGNRLPWEQSTFYLPAHKFSARIIWKICWRWWYAQFFFWDKQVFNMSLWHNISEKVANYVLVLQFFLSFSPTAQQHTQHGKTKDGGRLPQQEDWQTGHVTARSRFLTLPPEPSSTEIRPKNRLILLIFPSFFARAQVGKDRVDFWPSPLSSQPVLGIELLYKILGSPPNFEAMYFPYFSPILLC